MTLSVSEHHHVSIVQGELSHFTAGEDDAGLLRWQVTDDVSQHTALQGHTLTRYSKTMH